MLNLKDVEIIFLSLLNRRPTSTEMLEFIKYDTTHDIELKLMNSDEFNKHNNVQFFEQNFDNDTNVYTISNTNTYYDKGCLLTNTKWYFESSVFHDKPNRLNYSFNDNIEHTPIVNFTNLQFKIESKDINSIRRLNQSLDMNNCKFVDTLMLNDEILITIEKMALQYHKPIFVQKCTISSPYDCLLSVEQMFDKNVKFSSFIKIINDTNNYKHFSKIDYKHYQLISMYACETNKIIYGGLQEETDTQMKSCFSIEINGGIHTDFYVLTSPEHNVNDLVQLYNIYGLNGLISQHLHTWNTKWKTVFTSLRKNQAIPDDIANFDKFVSILKYSLFELYTNTDHVDLLYGLPVLMCFNTYVAKQVLTKLINANNNNYMYENKYKLYDIALLSIHIWNYFRISKDKNWLQSIGFPSMRNAADILLRFMDEDDDVKISVGLNKNRASKNVMTKYLIALAFKYTIQAIYELNYINLNLYKNAFEKLSKLNYFEENVLININTKEIHIKLGYANGLYHYDFYDAEDTYIGYQFGGSNGKRMLLLPDTEYKFVFDSSIGNHPISFHYREYNEINLNYDIFVHTIKNIIEEPYFVCNSDKLFSYNLFVEDNLFSIYREKFNHLYGNNAFITNLTRNVLVPEKNYVVNTELEFIEPYLLFTSYYNHLFTESKDELVDIINDNIKYYQRFRVDNEYNVLTESFLQAMVAQYQHTYLTKRAKINIFYNNFLKSDLFKKYYNVAWENKSSLFLYLTCTCLFEISPVGETNNNRVLVKDYGLSFVQRNVLPEPFQSMRLTNVSVLNNKTISIINTLYVDSGFSSLLHGVKYVPILNETDHVMTIHVDLSNVYNELTMPDNLMYAVVLQDQNDQTEYTADMLNALVIPYNENKTFSINLPQPHTIINEKLLLEKLYNNKIHIYLDSKNTNNFYTKEISLLSDETSKLKNPTVHMNFELGSKNTITMRLIYNSLNNTLYDVFENVRIILNYSSVLVDKDLIIFKSTDESSGFVSIMTNDTESCKLTVDINFGNEIGGSQIDLGSLVFQLVIQDIDLLTADLPFYGKVINGYGTQKSLIKNIHFPDMNTIYPPAFHRVNLPNVFVYELYSITSNIRLYNPISSLYRIVHGTQIEQILLDSLITNDTESISMIYSHNESMITAVNDTSTEPSISKYYAKGINMYNMLMLDDSYTEITVHNTFVECVHLNNLVSNIETKIKDIYTGNGFTIVRTMDDTFFGIGYNEFYNLGMGHNINVYTLTQCLHIDTLTSTSNDLHISHFCINDKAVLICLNSKIVYGLGFNQMHRYLTLEENIINSITEYESDENSLLQTPILLSRINQFIERNNYIIESIHTGINSYKFLLKDQTTGEKKWFGIGENAYTSLGLHRNISSDVVVEHMKRLHNIEALLDKTYDITYVGYNILDKNKYIMLSNGGYGEPNSYTAIYDKTSKIIYYIGKLNNGIHTSEWKILDDLKLYTTLLTNTNYITALPTAIHIGSTTSMTEEN